MESHSEQMGFTALSGEGSHCVKVFDGGHIVVLSLQPGASIKTSDFPHPLLTVDYNANMEIVQLDMAQAIVSTCMHEYGSWLARGAKDAPTLLRMMTDALDRRDHPLGH